MEFVNITFLAKKESGLSYNSIVILSVIYYASCNTESGHPGWCTLSKNKISAITGIPRTTVMYLLEESSKYIIQHEKRSMFLAIKPEYFKWFSNQNRRPADISGVPYLDGRPTGNRRPADRKQTAGRQETDGRPTSIYNESNELNQSNELVLGFDSIFPPFTKERLNALRLQFRSKTLPKPEWDALTDDQKQQVKKAAILPDHLWDEESSMAN